MKQHKLTPFIDNIVFGEAPRWHDGALWFSDIKDHCVNRVSQSGEITKILELECEPSGLGWLPNGDLLIVSMLDHKLLRYNGVDVVEVADFSQYCGGKANDMVVDQYGHAFIGNIGFDLDAKPIAPVSTQVLRIDPDGSVTIAATDVWCPNGMGITPDGKMLLVAQSASTEMLGFELASSGELSSRHTYTSLPEGATYDGICVDEEGAVWVANPVGQEFLRALPGGVITDRVDTNGMQAIACMLGGEDRKTLFCIVNQTNDLSAASKVRGGSIATLRVDVRGAGLP